MSRYHDSYDGYDDTSSSVRVLRRRPEVQEDERTVYREVIAGRGAPRFDQHLVLRPKTEDYYYKSDRRASSLPRRRIVDYEADDDDYDHDRRSQAREGGTLVPYRPRHDDGAVSRYRDRSDRDRDTAADSEDDSPRPRRANTNRGRASSRGPDKARSKRSSSSSSSSTDLGSSTDDENRMKKMKRKKWLTYGLASVATIHAAAALHGAVKGRQQGREEVAAGELSPEEAKKKEQQWRWREAGAVGLAGLGIYQAWNETKESYELRQEHRHIMEENEERHRRRREREQRHRDNQRQRARSSAGNGRDRDRDRD